MNKIVAFIFLFISSCVYSQKFTASLLNIHNKTYLGVDCPVSCTVEGEPFQSIVLTTANGTITREGDFFIFRPVTTGGTTITINTKKNGKLKKAGDFFIEVQPIPKPVAYVAAGKRNDTISKGALQAQEGVGCDWRIPGFELGCRIDSFSVTIIRNKGNIACQSLNGTRFTKEIHDLFDSLLSNDHVLIYGLFAHDPSGKIYNPDPIEFVIQ